MKIYNLKKLLRYIKKQNKKEEKKRRRKYLMPGNELGNFYARVRFATTTPPLKSR